MTRSSLSPVDYGGFGVVAAIGVVFLMLRLAHVLDWPWLFVTLPFWGTAVIVFIVLLIERLVGPGLWR